MAVYYFEISLTLLAITCFVTAFFPKSDFAIKSKKDCRTAVIWVGLLWPLAIWVIPFYYIWYKPHYKDQCNHK